MNRKRIKIGRSTCTTWLGRSRGICCASDASRSANRSFGGPRVAWARLGNGGYCHHDPAQRLSVVEPVFGRWIRLKYKTHKA